VKPSPSSAQSHTRNTSGQQIKRGNHAKRTPYVPAPFAASMAERLERLLRDSPAAISRASALAPLVASAVAAESSVFMLLLLPLPPPVPEERWLLELRDLLDCDGAAVATGSTMPRLLRLVLREMLPGWSNVNTLRGAYGMEDAPVSEAPREHV
jgi:hypothetical protein